MTPDLISILFVGDSHVLGYAEGQGDMHGSDGKIYSGTFKPVWFGTAYEALDLVVTFPDGRTALNPKLADQVRMWPGLDVKGRPADSSQRVHKALVLSFGTALGNYDPALDSDDRKTERIMFPSGIDFIPPNRPDAPVDSSKNLIPGALIAEMFDAILNPLRTALAILKEETSRAIYVVGCPPPARDDRKRREILLKRAKAMGLENLDLPSSQVLLKTWSLVSSQVEGICSAAECSFIPALEVLCDEDGFLKPEFEGDGIHANSNYNEQMLRRISECVLRGVVERDAR